MIGFESLLAVLLVAVLLAALARRVGAPYPAFLALGGAVLAFMPGAPRFSIDPEVALALFVAPVLLDAAYDSSPRDLRDNWVPVASLAVVSVLLTTAAVAVVARALVPAMPWAAADRARRDRLAARRGGRDGGPAAAPAAASNPDDPRGREPPERRERAADLPAGRRRGRDERVLARKPGADAPARRRRQHRRRASCSRWLVLWLTSSVRDVPTAIILQFISTFGVWILADRLGLSSVLTMVCFAISVARRAPARTPARLRLPSYAVWETAVFVLNVLAFVFIGLQIRPILASLEPADAACAISRSPASVLADGDPRADRLGDAAQLRRALEESAASAFIPRGPMQPPTLGGGIVVSWAGMRGIVTLAAALALPDRADGTEFPFRDLIVLTAFAVVLGTLVVQGLTLKPLIRALDLEDDDPVGREVEAARQRALEAALATLDGDESPAAEAVRQELAAHLGRGAEGPDEVGDGAPSHEEIHRRALAAARRAVLDMRARDEIGDDAFHRLEEELDWIEMGIG